MRFKEGSLYCVTFYDHCVGFDEIVKVHVVGFVYEDTDKEVKLTHWKEEHPEWKDSIEKTCIVKSTIIERKKLL